MQIEDRRARPEWLRKEKPVTGEVLANKARIGRLGLHTVCESARCPNMSECLSCGSATFLIMGRSCTRRCSFCSVAHGVPEPLDPTEGGRIAGYMLNAGLRFAVITSVTRDDLPDGGAGHFERVVGDIRRLLPHLGLELLVPDFRGSLESVDTVADSPIDVFGHNVETVESLYGRARGGADYGRSLAVLSRAAGRRGACMTVKSGIMVGLGESRGELERLFRDLAGAGVRALTIGQYLRPSRESLPVSRYVPPEEFRELGEAARSAGIPAVLSGPYIRSSYRAQSLAREAARVSSSGHSPEAGNGKKI